MSEVILPGVGIDSVVGVTPVREDLVRADIEFDKLKKHKNISEGDIQFVDDNEKRLWEAMFMDGSTLQAKCKNSNSLYLLSLVVKGDTPINIKEVQKENNSLINIQCIVLKDENEKMAEDYKFKDEDFEGTIQWLGGDEYELCVYKLSERVTLHHVLNWLPNSVNSNIRSGDTLYSASYTGPTREQKQDGDSYCNAAIASEYVSRDKLDEFLRCMPSVPLSRKEIESFAEMFNSVHK